MSAITSGTYGLQQPSLGSAFLQKLVALFVPSQPRDVRFADVYRLRMREANDVRELARSVESHSPGFASDLYSAAMRHENTDR